MLLITGATGLVGGLLRHTLPGEKIGLSRFKQPQERGLTWVRGDVGVDGLGLSARLRRFAHVSTVYVLGAEQGTLAEGPAQATRWISSYEQSKYESENVVLDAA